MPRRQRGHTRNKRRKNLGPRRGAAGRQPQVSLDFPRRMDGGRWTEKNRDKRVRDGRRRGASHPSLDHHAQNTSMASAAAILMQPLMQRAAGGGCRQKRHHPDQQCGQSRLAGALHASQKPLHNSSNIAFPARSASPIWHNRRDPGGRRRRCGWTSPQRGWIFKYESNQRKI